MPRGDKGSYTDKQKRKAEHIEEGYEDRGVPKKEAEGRAWATVNKESGGGNKSGSGRGKKDTHVSSSRGGKAHKSRFARAAFGGRPQGLGNTAQTRPRLTIPELRALRDRMSYGYRAGRRATPIAVPMRRSVHAPMTQLVYGDTRVPVKISERFHSLKSPPPCHFCRSLSFCSSR